MSTATLLIVTARLRGLAQAGGYPHPPSAYPAEKGGKRYEGIDVDFDALFQAHWIIVTWCEGAVIELKGDV